MRGRSDLVQAPDRRQRGGTPASIGPDHPEDGGPCLAPERLPFTPQEARCRLLAPSSYRHAPTPAALVSDLDELPLLRAAQRCHDGPCCAKTADGARDGPRRRERAD